MSAAVGVPGDLLMGRGVLVKCSRCGTDVVNVNDGKKGGSHPRAYCSAKMVERDLRERGYVPLLGCQVKLAKMGRVQMVKRTYMAEGTRIMQGQQPLKLYGPVWFAYLAKRVELKNVSIRRPVVRDFIDKVRTINSSFPEQKLVAAEILFAETEYHDAARSFLRIYSVENVDLVAFRDRQLRIMRGDDRPKIL